MTAALLVLAGCCRFSDATRCGVRNGPVEQGQPIYPSVPSGPVTGNLRGTFDAVAFEGVAYEPFEASFWLHNRSWATYGQFERDRAAYAMRLSTVRVAARPDAWAAVPWVHPDAVFPPDVAPAGDAAYTAAAVHALAMCYYAKYPGDEALFEGAELPGCALVDVPTPADVRAHAVAPPSPPPG